MGGIVIIKRGRMLLEAHGRGKVKVWGLEDEPPVRLAYLGVRQDAQGLGIGSALIWAAVERFGTVWGGCKPWAGPGFPPADPERLRAFYDRLGVTWQNPHFWTLTKEAAENAKRARGDV